MDGRRYVLIISVFASACIRCSCAADDHIVGDSIWSIPPRADFYRNWSNNRSFEVGDSLVFRFETGFYNVMQVSRREYESCHAENPFKSSLIGPATMPLNEEGMHYFVCSFGNYCLLGQKLYVSVHRPLSSTENPSIVMRPL